MSAYNRTFAVAILLLVVCPLTLFAAAGIAPERIWVSREPLVAGERTTVSTIIQNSTQEPFSGVVRFHDGTTTIGEAPFSVEPGSASIVSIDWLVPAGTHRLFALITDTSMGAATTSLSKDLTESGILERTAVVDTDRDGIPDDTDADDDNDGIGDADDDDPLIARQPEQAARRASTTRVSLSSLPGYIEAPLGAIEDARLAHLDAAEEYLHDAYATLRKSLSSGKDPTGEKSGVTIGWESGATWKEFVRSVDSGDLVKSPLEYAKFFFWAAYVWVLERPWAFYLIGLLVILWCIRLVSALYHR